MTDLNIKNMKIIIIIIIIIIYKISDLYAEFKKDSSHLYPAKDFALNPIS